MSTHRAFDKICCVILALTILLTASFYLLPIPVTEGFAASLGYENRLFDDSAVHTVDIVMDEWEDFLENCQSEEYYACTVVIDNEAYKNVGLRAKGNTSLTQVASYGNDRYSFKIEFDHYDSSMTYHGLDKLCLNNIIQDNTYMKDYLCYKMMSNAGVASPLCSYTYITVNGEDWGLYLAVEGIEESFLKRNYGTDYGELYKPDSSQMGGGRGMGENFDIDDFFSGESFFDGVWDEAFENSEEGFDFRNDKAEGFGGMMASDDVLLKYIDGDSDSYKNIFDNAKTEISDSDKARLIESLRRLSEGENIEDVVDTEKVAEYFAVHNFVLNFDSYTGSMIHNYYLYEKDGVLQMLPWDYNLAFGGFQGAEDATALVNYPIDTPVSGGDAEDRPMIAWIFRNEEYTELYHSCLDKLLSEFFENGEFESLMTSVVDMISPYVEKDPTKFCTYDEFILGTDTLRTFCLLRAESVRGQLEGEIGATDSTQTADELVDADGISISDMGEMNNGGSHGGMNGGVGGMFFGAPDGESPADTGSTPPENSELPDDEMTPPDNIGEGDRTPHDGQTPPSDSETLWGTETSPDGKTLPDGDMGAFSENGKMPDMGNDFVVGEAVSFKGAAEDNIEIPVPEPSESKPQMPDKDSFSPENGDFIPENGKRPDGGTGGEDDNSVPFEKGEMKELSATSFSAEDIISAAVSIALLAFGIIFALLYRRRK